MRANCRVCGKMYKGRAEHCTVCHETFTGSVSGDKHSVGKHGVREGPDRRRCRTVEEMQEAGMVQNKYGWWKANDNVVDWDSLSRTSDEEE